MPTLKHYPPKKLKNGDISIRYYFHDKHTNKPVSDTFRLSEFGSMDEMELAAHQQMIDYFKRQEIKYGPLSKLKLKDAYERYYDNHLKNKTEHTRRNNDSAFKVINHFIGDEYIFKLNRLFLQTVYVELRRRGSASYQYTPGNWKKKGKDGGYKPREAVRGLKPATDRQIKNDLVYIRKIVFWYHDQYMLQRPNFNGIFSQLKIPRVPGHEKMHTVSEVEMIANHSIYTQWIVSTFYYTGLRKSEVANIKLTDIDLDKNLIWIGREVKTKNGDVRFVIIPPPFKPILEQIMTNGIYFKPGHPGWENELKPRVKSPYLFHKADGSKFKDGWTRSLSTACKAAGIKPSKVHHKIRHSYSSELFDKGVQPQLISDMLGQRSKSVAQDHYIHTQTKQMVEAAAKMAPLKLNPPQ